MLRFSHIILCVLFWVLPGFRAGAASFTATIDGMTVTVSAPWQLLTRTAPELSPERFALIRTDHDAGGGDITGEGAACLHPLGTDQRPPLPEALEAMAPQDLLAFLRVLGGNRPFFPEPQGEPELIRMGGHSVIVCKSFQPGTERVPEPCHSRIYYHLFSHAVVTLSAYSCGTEDDARLLDSICASFNPEDAVGRERPGPNRVTQGGLSFDFPGGWEIWIAPMGEEEGPVWARLRKMDRDEKILAEVALMTPLNTSVFPEPGEDWQRFRYSVWERDYTVLIAGTGLTPGAFRMTSREQKTLHGRETMLTAYTGTAGEKPMQAEVRHVALKKGMLGMITGYPLPLNPNLRAELESIYAAIKEQGSGCFTPENQPDGGGTF